MKDQAPAGAAAAACLVNVRRIAWSRGQSMSVACWGAGWFNRARNNLSRSPCHPCSQPARAHHLRNTTLTLSRADTAHPAHCIATSTISQLSMPISLKVTWSMMEADVANVAAAAGLANVPRPSEVASKGTLRITSEERGFVRDQMPLAAVWTSSILVAEASANLLASPHQHAVLFAAGDPRSPGNHT